jgi:S-DNA-T family DNA segregation ATPase FtsK/SpoIIIE
LVRLQGCFVSDDELARLTNHWRALQEEFDYTSAAPWDEHAGGDAGGDGAPRGDELMDAAIELIGKSNTASISMLQRKLGIGYPRAARLMDQLEERGVVGPDEGGGKPRAVMVQDATKKKK